MLKRILLLIFIAYSGSIFCSPLKYVDNRLCLSCHQKQAKQWQGSDHYFSMLPANPQSVLGDFNNQTFKTKTQSIEFSQQKGQYFIIVTSAEKPRQKYEVKYTFGYHPLQQYLVQFPNGKLQAFNIAWDSTKNKWFNLAKEEDLFEGSPLHWSKRFYNWNHNCAECHSTNYKKNYQNGRYNSQFSGVNVNCQACHGPGSKHIQWAQNKTTDNRGLAIDFNTMTAKHKVELCAHCHSRRAQVSKQHQINKPFQEQYIPALLRDDLYYPDGQIKDEVFVYGSFIQSKMHQAGVQCMDCHNPHSLKLILPGNKVCTQCHNPNPVKRFQALDGKHTNYDAFDHTHHPVKSQASQCISCHMPKTTFMKVDPRADHAFKVPNPELTIKYGIPNACNRCHQDKSPKWAKQKILKWFGRLYSNTPLLTGSQKQLLELYQDTRSPDIFRASALMLLATQAKENQKAIEAALQEDAPMFKIAALNKLSQSQQAMPQAIIKPLLNDSNTIIKGTAAGLLASSRLSKSQIKAYIDLQTPNLDQPESHINLAHFYLKRQKFDKAKSQLEVAIAKDPHFIPAYLSLAKLLSGLNQAHKTSLTLQKGINANPNNASLYYHIGLAYAAENNLVDASLAFKHCLSINKRYPRAEYNLSLVLWKLGEKQQAQQRLEKALQLDPQDVTLINNMIYFSVQSHNQKNVVKYLKQLLAIQPNNKQAADLLHQLGH